MMASRQVLSALSAALETFERDHGIDPVVEEACFVLIDGQGNVFNLTSKDIRRGGPEVDRFAACFEPASSDAGGLKSGFGAR